MSVDVNKLRKLTAEAVERGRLEAQRLAEEVAEKTRLKQIAEERKAHNVIEQIPGRAEKEAALGRNYAIVMAVKYEDYDRVCTPKSLKGAVKLVYDYCVEADLNPTLESWHDGCGMNSGHNIVIHW